MSRLNVKKPPFEWIHFSVVLGIGVVLYLWAFLINPNHYWVLAFYYFTIGMLDEVCQMGLPAHGFGQAGVIFGLWFTTQRFNHFGSLFLAIAAYFIARFVMGCFMETAEDYDKFRREYKRNLRFAQEQAELEEQRRYEETVRKLEEEKRQNKRQSKQKTKTDNVIQFKR